jgi:AcrR family transcriptional regulator
MRPETAHETPRALRCDAARNRERILEAARAAFLEHGLDVPLREIAARAGVGVGTLYRRFPARDALVDACFKRKVDQYLAAAEAALEQEDAWAGFSGFVERICEMQAEDEGFKDVMTTIFPTAKGLEDERSRAYVALKAIVARAQEQGSLRPDFTAEDLAFVVWANAAYLEATKDIASRAWRRYVALLLHSFRAENAQPLPEPPLSERQLLRTMIRLRPTSGDPPERLRARRA